MAKYNTKGHRKTRKDYSLLPLILVMLMIPLIVRMITYDSRLSQFDWFPNKAEAVDLFLYWKSVALTVIGVTLAVLISMRLRKESLSLKKNLWICFLAGYGGLAFLSTLFSEYRSFGFSGIYEQFESIWVVLTYCLITVYAYLVVRKDSDLQTIRKTMFILLTIMGCLGMTQLLGHDFFESALGKFLIAPADARSSLVFNFSGSGTHQVYLTLYNPNYVGVFASLLMPIAVMLIFITDKKWAKFLWVALAVLLMVCTFGSGSKTFLISFVASLILALFFCRRLILRYWKFMIPLAILIMVVSGWYFRIHNLNPFQYVKNAVMVSENNYSLKDFGVDENGFYVNYNDEKLNFAYYDIDGYVCFEVTDGKGTVLETLPLGGGQHGINDGRYLNFRIALYQGDEVHPYYAGVSISGAAPLMFTKDETGYAFVNSGLKIDEIKPAESAILTNYLRFASGRGYIWSRTFPLLKDSIILGTGADTFSLVFPHDDYVMRYNAGYHTELITRPHNMYLQIAVQHGFLALICYLVVCLIYFLQSCKLYWKADISNKHHLLGIGIMLGVVGYLIAGIPNDSTITVAPLFWAWLGIGFAVNKMNKEETIKVE